ncbi:MAG: ECF-type sigma factor [Phycisphaerales bacterium]
MNPDEDLSQLMSALGSSDPESSRRASEELLRLIMVFVRSQMGDHLRRGRESADVCQSVAKSVVADLGGGKIELRSEGELVEYLKTSVRHKLVDLARSDTAAKRGGGAAAGLGDMDPECESGDETIESGEFMAVWNDLSQEERDLAYFRLRGMEWDQISLQTGKSAVSLRQQWSRLVRRLRPE